MYPIAYCDGSPVNEVCPTSGLHEQNVLTALIYPNPAQNAIQVVPSIEGKYTVSILDNTGRILSFIELEKGIAEISLIALTNGNYFVQVNSGKYLYTEQLIKY